MASLSLAIFLDLIICGIFILIGVFANKQKKVVFIIGMILYGLDTIILIIARDFIGVGCHAIALFSIFGGFKAIKELKQFMQQSGLSQVVNDLGATSPQEDNLI